MPLALPPLLPSPPPPCMLEAFWIACHSMMHLMLKPLPAVLCRSNTLSHLAPHAPERPLLGQASLTGASVTMLQSMTARAVSFQAGSLHNALAPPSPVPSIDRFSSMSSWGASSSSPGSCHGSCSTPPHNCTAGDCTNIMFARPRFGKNGVKAYYILSTVKQVDASSSKDLLCALMPHLHKAQCCFETRPSIKSMITLAASIHLESILLLHQKCPI